MTTRAEQLYISHTHKPYKVLRHNILHDIRRTRNGQVHHNYTYKVIALYSLSSLQPSQPNAPANTQSIIPRITDPLLKLKIAVAASIPLRNILPKIRQFLFTFVYLLIQCRKNYSIVNILLIVFSKFHHFNNKFC